ncbi:MAG: exodeoxyribonuclease III [Methanomicrobiales archaeon HGW-Methanomicrobiales-4]|nr:MAG: exodeoxyribonuclease III [Methanomicrobiales archaeon HGW-Methanomicrobiales-4]
MTNRYRILSWNVNGLHAIAGKEIWDGQNFPEFLIHDNPDICCLQETKVDAKSLPAEVSRIGNYFFYLNPAERKGYSGVGLYTRREPEEIKYGFGYSEFDHEGRVIIGRYPEFTLYSVYFPNGGASDERLGFKLRFYDAFLNHIKERNEAGDRIVVCGDLNTAHFPIDLARPKENSMVSGFLPIEREWLDRFIDAGFIDTFRLFKSDGDNYTWWDYKTKARSRNVGWRIDYFFVNERMRSHVLSSVIRSEVMGSDHCPVELVIQF